MPATNLRRISIAAIFALVATLFQGASLSPASAAAISATRVNVTRDYNSNDGSFKVYNGESLSIYTYFQIDLTTVEAGEVLTFSESIGEITGLTARWFYSTGVGPSVETSASTFTVPETLPSSISLTVTKSLSASADGTKRFVPSVTSSDDTVEFTDNYTVVSKNAVVSGGYVAKQEDQSLSYNLDACVDMSAVAPGEDLTLSITMSPSTGSSYGTSTYWTSDSSQLLASGSQTELERTVPTPEPTTLRVSFSRNFSGLTAGESYALTADIKKGNTSVTLSSCPSNNMMQALYPKAGGTLSGNLTVGSVLTATPSTWSLTSGGAAITPQSQTARWYVCDSSDSQSYDMNHAEDPPSCFMQMNLIRVLADGNSIGSTGTSYSGTTLTLTPALMNALNGKYLAVMLNATATGGIFGNLLLPTCGAIGTASTCSVSAGGTPPVVAPAKKTPKAAVVATKIKVGKSFTIALHATKGTASKAANADGLGAVVSVTSASKKYCSVTKIVKSKKITGYTVKGLKAGKCSVVVAISGSSTFNASTKTTVVTVSK